MAEDHRCPPVQASTWLRFTVSRHLSNVNPGPRNDCFCICWFIVWNPHPALFLKGLILPFPQMQSLWLREGEQLAQGHAVSRSAVEGECGLPAVTPALSVPAEECPLCTPSRRFIRALPVLFWCFPEEAPPRRSVRPCLPVSLSHRSQVS